MIRVYYLCVLLLFVGAPMLDAQDDAGLRKSVVKVFSTSNRLNLTSPWKRGDGVQSSGSGVWLGGNRVLTNEHVVDYATQISVQPYESAERMPAVVVAVSPEMDLAILELDSDEAFEQLEPPAFADELPKLRTTVRVYGFPEGGNTLSVTEGIVSRIEYRNYSYSARGLRVQVDAAINPGNSGGPAFVDDKIIGIAFQKRRRSDNIGYLIPSEELLAFLDDVEDDKYDGKPVIEVVVQKLMNRTLRMNLNLSRGTTGVWVREVMSEDDDYPLQVGDVITHLGDHDIDNSGMTKLGADLRVSFTYFVPHVVENGTVPVRIIREGEKMTLNVPVRLARQPLLRSLKGEYPQYFVYGPLVFIPGMTDYLAGLEAYLNSSDARRRVSGIASMAMLGRRRSPLVLRRFDFPEFENEQLVMVTNWLPHRISIGYSSPTTQVVDSVNGVVIRNLAHLVGTLRDLDDEYVEFQFKDRAVEKLIFNRQELEAATDDILLNNGIPRQGSSNLLKIWQQRQLATQ